MIKLQDAIIQSDTQSILDMLKFDLAQHGVDRFHIFRNNGDNVQTNCPFHKNGQERKPSFGVNGEIDKCHCFACGWSGTIEEMISELYGYQDEGKFGRRWLIKRFNTVEIETRKNIMEEFKNGNSALYSSAYNRSDKRSDRILCRKTRQIMEGFNERKINLSGGIYKSIEPTSKGKSGEMGEAGKGYEYEKNRDLEERDETVITEEELDKYRYIHPYMYERGLTDDIIERFDIGYDREQREITFPIRDITGRCVFVAGRSVEKKFFRLPKGIDKPIYQGYKFTSGIYRTAYITESFLNCLTCWKYDKPAMAMIGTGNQKQYEILNKLPVREYILAFDPDEAGRKATERFRKNVHGKIIKELVYSDNRDINDLQEEFLNCKIIF